MAISETILDALGGLLNAKVYKTKTFCSEELNFERYGNLYFSVGQIKEKEAEKKEINY